MKLESFLEQAVQTQYSTFSDLEALLETERKAFDHWIGQPLDSFQKDDIVSLKLRFSGKKSPLQELLQSIKVLPAQERKDAGKLINTLRDHIQGHLTNFLSHLEEYFESKKLLSETVDFTRPWIHATKGSRHPVSIVIQDLLVPFEKMGFSVIDGPEIENEFYNFEALNVVKDHPAREMQDTFFLSSEWVLRTHTSNSQIHAMKERSLPLKVVCPGCVYRNESDPTHVPSFRQMECLVVDKGIHMGHLRHLISELLRVAFDRPVKLRFRSSYYPFTEPSADVDVECQQCFGKRCRSCKYTGFSEIGGCGVVNRKVIEACGLDPNEYSGIAFGFGVDRIAMSRFAIDDLRKMFDGDVEFLKTYSQI